MKISRISGRLFWWEGQYVGRGGGRIFMFELSIARRRVLPLVLVAKQPHDECFALRSPATIKYFPSVLKKLLKLSVVIFGPGGQ